MQIELDVTDVLPTIRVPTLVIAKDFDREEAETVAAAIPDAAFVVVPGRGGAF
jgi:pimeloyl-ACP methyl ester carboxylesterase